MKELWIKYNGYILYIVILCIAFFLGAFVYEATAQVISEPDIILEIELLSDNAINEFSTTGRYEHIPPFTVDGFTYQRDHYKTPHGDVGYIIKIIDDDNQILYQKCYGSERDERTGVWENQDSLHPVLAHTDIDAYLSGLRISR